MRNVAVFGAAGGGGVAFPSVEIDEMVVRSSVVHTPEPAFRAADPAHARDVLVQVSAFSCNYRDKGFMSWLQQVPPGRFFVIGSEFAGRVVETGPAVKGLRPGDRVVANHHFSGAGLMRPDGRTPDGLVEGIATNHASREFQVLDERKLLRIPDAMPDEEAAAFSLGAQTAYSMVRKVAPTPGANVLVTAATSNTSLYLIPALRRRGARVFASTTSRASDARLRALGADHVIHVGGDGERFRDSTRLTELAREVGWFECVLDPFFDLHLRKAVEILAPFGRYTTCGFVAQNPGAARSAGVEPLDAELILQAVMMKNLSLIGNCIGLHEDLEHAVQDYAAGHLKPVVDSVLGGDDTARFLERTFLSRDRFGKVVFRYDPN